MAFDSDILLADYIQTEEAVGHIVLLGKVYNPTEKEVGHIVDHHERHPPPQLCYDVQSAH